MLTDDHHAFDGPPGNLQAALALLARPHKVNMECRDHEGMTPLALACYYAHGQMVELLIDSGANVDARIGPSQVGCA